MFEYKYIYEYNFFGDNMGNNFKSYYRFHFTSTSLENTGPVLHVYKTC